MSDKVKKIGGISFVNTKSGTYAISMDCPEDTFSSHLFSTYGNWETTPCNIKGVKVVPHGADNRLPTNTRDLLEKNNLGPGIIDRKTGLQYAQGAYTYRLKVENNEIVREWVIDKDVESWLSTWDYREFIRNAFLEFNYLRGYYVKYFQGKGIRIGSRNWIAKLECEHSIDCRLEYPSNGGRRYEDVDHLLVYDFDDFSSSIMKRYPKFDPYNPSNDGVAMYYHSFRTFGRYFYSLPSFLGSMPWVKRANDIPEIIRYLTDNMIAAAYIVHQPAAYWDDKANKLMDAHPEWDDAKVANEIVKIREKLTAMIAEVMAGKRNVGKFLEVVDFYDEEGNLCQWKVEPIEMNIDKYVEAQAKISRIADSSTTSGFGLSPALSNIIIDGKSDSGSQMLYALKIFYAADTQIAEDIIFEALNHALRINFPEKGLFMGIYKKAVNKEDNVSANDRVTNNM